MRKIIYLLFLCVGIVGCSAEALDSNENFITSDLTAANEEPVADMPGATSWDLINLKNGKLKGKVSVANDCDNLYVQIETEEDANLGVYQDGEALPPINGNNENVSPELELSGEGTTTWIFALVDFTSDKVMIFANAGGHSWGGDLPHGNAKYFVYTFNDESCAEVCTRGKGYWWNHGPNGNPGNQNNEWPEGLEGLELGNITYDLEELGQIYDRNTTGGNGLVSVAHHLITTELNIANGTDPSAVSAALQEAHEFIGDANPLEDFIDQSEVGEFKNVLEAYNEGEIGPGSCDDSEEETEE